MRLCLCRLPSVFVEEAEEKDQGLAHTEYKVSCDERSAYASLGCQLGNPSRSVDLLSVGAYREVRNRCPCRLLSSSSALDASACWLFFESICCVHHLFPLQNISGKAISHRDGPHPYDGGPGEHFIFRVCLDSLVTVAVKCRT